MKSLRLLGLIAGAAVAIAASLPSGPTPITLAWDYPAADLSTGLVFRVYHTTTITTPVANWAVITNVAGTNLSVTLTVTPGARFYVVTASNFWGESDPSNVASTPELPRSDVNLRLRKGL